jgi:hypothetical protein
MTKDKYLASIDKVLVNTLRKEAKSLGEKTVIPYSIDMEKTGEITKFAFDVYKVDNDPYNGLWTLEDIDGRQHLVRASDPQFEENARGDWSVISDYDRANVTLAYKKVPVARFGSKDYGFGSDDISTFKSALLERIHQDESFVKDVFAEQPATKREALGKSFPELTKFIKG